LDPLSLPGRPDRESFLQNHGGNRSGNTHDLGFEIIELAGAIKRLETFDRLIFATAKHLGLPILTFDEEIKDRSGIEVIWD
jgi:predicted nucleic acid-binding protein